MLRYDNNNNGFGDYYYCTVATDVSLHLCASTASVTSTRIYVYLLDTLHDSLLIKSLPLGCFVVTCKVWQFTSIPCITTCKF